MKLLTKVAKGVAYGDVSNQAVRNILTEISKSINGGITEQEMYDTMEFFDWKCPYTGRDLKKSLEDGDGSYAADHIYPQNRDWCGLNVKGNLVIVDKAANAAKRGFDVDKFLLEDTKALGDLDITIRQQRLQKIKDFQVACGYDPEKIRKIVSPILEDRYAAVRKEQEKCIDDVLEALKIEKIDILPKTVTVTKPSSTTKRGSLPELIFYPADEQLFKTELIKTKNAKFVLTYDSGAVKTSLWNANAFDSSSNLRANIQSRPFWRKKNQEGLIKVEVFID